jgi:UPF0755 protein
LKRRRVATIEWLRLFPNDGFLPQTEQTLDTAAECSETVKEAAAGPGDGNALPIVSIVRSFRFLLVLVAAAAFAAGMEARAAAPAPLRIAFPEGWSARQMADRVAEVRRIAIRTRGVTPRLTGTAYRRATAAARPPRAFARLVERRSVEGFLFPDTYEFTATTSAANLVARQLAVFERRWRTVDLRVARSRGLDPYEVLIVASLVERETVVPRERALVAAVIANRLDEGMPLGIDASLRYGLGIEGTRPITRTHLRSSTPYNTHRFKGLPPTPIGNPGLASIRAAARPASVDHLFYLRIPGTLRHFFTADEQEFCAKALEFGYAGC